MLSSMTNLCLSDYHKTCPKCLTHEIAYVSQTLKIENGILNCIPVGVGRSYAHRHKMCTLYVMFSPIFNSVLFDIYFVLEFIFYSVNILDCHVRPPFFIISDN